MPGATHNRWLIVGFAASLLLHVAVGLALAAFAPRGPGDVDLESPLSLPEPPRPERVLGIDRSRNVTVDWLGFEDPTPHAAMQAESDQSALAPDPAVPTPPAPPPPAPPILSEPPAPTPPPEPEAVPEPFEQPEPPPGDPEPPPLVESPAPDILIQRPEAPEPRDAEPPPPESDEASPARPAAQQPWREMLERLLEAARQATQPTPPSPQPQPPQPAAPSARPALPDPREADATSRDAVLDVSPGKVAAREGLRVETVRPEWSVTTRLINLPRNPEVWIRFDRAGRVREAGFVVRDGRTLSTGSPAVDGPLLDAIYRWRASGAQIEALDPDDPGARVSITMRIVLRT